MEDEGLDLGFQEAAVPFESAPQNARIWTEQWADASLFCPNCGAARLHRFAGNRPEADFFCATCNEEFELKSRKGRFGRKVVDGAFGTMCARLAAENNPSLVLLNYDMARFRVTDLFFVPKHFFVREIVEERKPLADTARRAGWIGCNILLGEIPDSGKIFFVRGGETMPRNAVIEKWRSTLFLRQTSDGARGWLIEVMKCVEKIGRTDFTLDDVYAFEDELMALFPGNRHVKPKIRQQLQVLRDQGFLQFTARGRNRLTAATG